MQNTIRNFAGTVSVEIKKVIGEMTALDIINRVIIALLGMFAIYFFYSWGLLLEYFCINSPLTHTDLSTRLEFLQWSYWYMLARAANSVDWGLFIFTIAVIAANIDNQLQFWKKFWKHKPA